MHTPMNDEALGQGVTSEMTHAAAGTTTAPTSETTPHETASPSSYIRPATSVAAMARLFEQNASLTVPSARPTFQPPRQPRTQGLPEPDQQARGDYSSDGQPVEPMPAADASYQVSSLPDREDWTSRQRDDGDSVSHSSQLPHLSSGQPEASMPYDPSGDYKALLTSVSSLPPSPSTLASAAQSDAQNHGPKTHEETDMRRNDSRAHAETHSGEDHERTNPTPQADAATTAASQRHSARLTAAKHHRQRGVLDPNHLSFDPSNTQSRISVGPLGDVFRGTYYNEPVAVRRVRIPSNTGYGGLGSGASSSMSQQEDALERFAQDVKVYESIQHPNIVQFMGVVMNEPESSAGATSPWRSAQNIQPAILLVSEHMEGGTLAEALNALRERNAACSARYSSMSREEQMALHQSTFAYEPLTRIAVDVASGLRKLHQANLYHGDLSPSTILLTAGVQKKRSLAGDSLSMHRSSSQDSTDSEDTHDADMIELPNNVRAKIADFGLSMPQEFLMDMTASASATACFSGAFQYTAPEAFVDAASNDIQTRKASDVYAFAVVLYEMLTLMRPWSRRDLMNVHAAVRHRRERPPWPADTDVPDRLRHLVDRMWAHDPGRRPDIVDVFKELRYVYAGVVSAGGSTSALGSTRTIASSAATSVHNASTSTQLEALPTDSLSHQMSSGSIAVAVPDESVYDLGSSAEQARPEVFPHVPDDTIIDGSDSASDSGSDPDSDYTLHVPAQNDEGATYGDEAVGGDVGIMESVIHVEVPFRPSGEHEGTNGGDSDSDREGEKHEEHEGEDVAQDETRFEGQTRRDTENSGVSQRSEGYTAALGRDDSKFSPLTTDTDTPTPRAGRPPLPRTRTLNTRPSLHPRPPTQQPKTEAVAAAAAEATVGPDTPDTQYMSGVSQDALSPRDGGFAHADSSSGAEQREERVGPEESLRRFSPPPNSLLPDRRAPMLQPSLELPPGAVAAYPPVSGGMSSGIVRAESARASPAHPAQSGAASSGGPSSGNDLALMNTADFEDFKGQFANMTAMVVHKQMALAAAVIAGGPSGINSASVDSNGTTGTDLQHHFSDRSLRSDDSTTATTTPHAADGTTGAGMARAETPVRASPSMDRAMRKKRSKRLKELIEESGLALLDMQRGNAGDDNSIPPARRRARARAAEADAAHLAEEERMLEIIRTAEEDTLQYDVVLRAMRGMKESVKVARAGIAALEKVAESEFRFRDACEDGAIDEIVAAAGRFEKDAEVCVLFCRAIRAFSVWYDDKIGHMIRGVGVPSLIVSMMEDHKGVEGVQTEGCLVIAAVCGANELNRSACATLGGPMAVHRAMTRNLTEFKSVELARASLNAFRAIADQNEDAASALVKVCALESVCLTGDTFANDGIECEVLGALESIAFYTEGRMLIVRSNGLKALANVMLRDDSPDFIRRCCRFVVDVCKLRIEECEREMMESSVAERMVVALRYESSVIGPGADEAGALIAYEAAQSLRFMATFGRRMQDHCRLVGGIDAIVKTLNTRFTDRYVAGMCCKALLALVLNNDEAIAYAETLPLRAILRRAQERHRKDELVEQDIRAALQVLDTGAGAPGRGRGSRRGVAGDNGATQATGPLRQIFRRDRASAGRR